MGLTLGAGRNHWDHITPFFDYPKEIRTVIYTTNAIESLNSSFRKISRSRHLFPSVESLYKLFYLAIENISKKWKMPIPNWSAQGTSLHVHKSLIFVYEGDFGINISLI